MRNPLRRKALSASPEALAAIRESGASFNLPLNAAVNAAFLQAQSSSYAHIFKTQPGVRTVVEFMARNVAQLALKLYVREEDGGRNEDGDHAAAVLMRNPNGWTTGEQFIYELVADFCVFDNAYALKMRPTDSGPLVLLRLPPYAVGVGGTNQFKPERYEIILQNGNRVPVEPENMIHWRGYNPEDPRVGVSKLETLRKLLVEDAVMQTAVIESQKNGGFNDAYIKRPLEAPDWSDNARQRFEEAWRNRTGGSANAGRRPVLEEGMELIESKISPKDRQMLESRIFTVAQVARLYGVPLGLLDLEDGDLEAERKMLYADVLPPIAAQLAGVLNHQLLKTEYGARNRYFEFLIDTKMEGDLEEQLSTLVSVAGAPILTRNEARKLKNLPALKGGDELITPMNVTVGGKPSPKEMPIPDPNTPAQDGSAREGDGPEAKVDPAILRKSLERMAKTIDSGGKLNVERWTSELLDDLEGERVAD